MASSKQDKDRKHDIVLAAFSALKKHGLPALSYDLISQESEFSRQLIRYYFSDPEDLMIALCDYLAETYRDTLIAGVMQAEGANRLSLFLDFYFDLLDDMRKPRDDAVYDALLSLSAGSQKIRSNLRSQYSLLGQVLTHEFAIQYPALNSQKAAELSYLLVVMMYGHWKMVASLGLSESHKHISRNAMDRLIRSYVDEADIDALDVQVWTQDE